MGECVGVVFVVALAAEKVGEVGEKVVGADVFVPVFVFVVMDVVFVPRMLPGLEVGAEVETEVLMVLMVFVCVKLLGPVTLVVVVGEAKVAAVPLDFELELELFFAALLSAVVVVVV